MMKKIFMSKTIVLAVIVSLISINTILAQVPTGVKLAKVQEIIRSNGSEPETLDPNLAESTVSHNILFDIFEGLVATTPEGDVVPGVASSWRRIDGSTWQFFLRKDAKFTNGEQVKAQDFVYGIQRFLDPKTASPYSGTYGPFILNGDEIVSGKMPPEMAGVKAISDTILEIKTSGNYEYFLQILVNTQFAPIHKATVDKHGSSWIRPGNIVSNGPYQLKEWQVNNKIVVEKNPYYHSADDIIITKATYLPIEDQSTDVKLFESGETDYVYSLPPGVTENLKNKYPDEFFNSPFLGLRYYSLNNKDPLLKDKRVRQALSMVIDRELLADKVTNDGQVPLYSVVVEGVAGSNTTTYDWAEWPMQRRIDYARALLKQAEVKEGTTLKMVYNTSEYHKKMAIFVVSEWKSKLGLNTELEAMEFRVLLKRRHDLEYQVARNGWVGDYNDATTFLTLIQCKSSQNDNGNCNEEADALFAEAETQTNPAKRKELITKGVALVMADYPMIPVLQYTNPRLVKSYVGGYNSSHPLDKHLTKYMYIKEH